MPKIYKYFSHDMMELIFKRDDFCGVKCSFPKDYNDPYELFLGVDLNAPTDCLASYKDIINEIHQHPTTCFSKSPIVSPMWAHYGKEHTGFVLEFDTEELGKYFQGILIRDVNYKNEPDEGLEDLLLRASRIKKPRYAYFLLQATFSEAYFSKYTDWSYEQEIRLVDLEGHTENIDGNNILFIPSSCVTSVILGSNFPSKKIDFSAKKATGYDLAWYRLKIGKSYPAPYMMDHSDGVFIFENANIVEAESVCESCSEPLTQKNDLCPWCGITEAHKLEAAMANPLRILDNYGELEKYLGEISKIGKKD